MDPSLALHTHPTFFPHLSHHLLHLHQSISSDLHCRTPKSVYPENWETASSQLSDHLKSGFEIGDSVWLYIPKVLPGLSRKLTHLIDQVRDDFKVKLKVQGTGYRVEPWVHISRLKPRALFPKRSFLRIDVSEEDNFDAALLPEDSWEPDSVHQEYEVEEIRNRNAKRIREYLIKWKGYDELQWLPVSQLKCGFLLYQFNQSARAKARLAAMQSGNDDYAEL
ncbi:hypothetical protein PHMEG_00033548 [Phytophthora megakarya]|uniref:Chromo domain-containing protein n=1 Tax=Phytophthora megakarya TaxID=4795 RepID=A0A225UUM3_9STRA|nr:hypothetical protein PHMEG_00033548 [Phytophthora megakarya]